jgi:hypothetical protein
MNSVRGAGRVEGRASPAGDAIVAPHVAQNLDPAETGELQRAHAGPDPGAESRRPQLGQNGSAALVGAPQNGQAVPARAGAPSRSL